MDDRYLLTDSLLAVDLGLKTGLALYNHTGRLQWYRSKNFGSPGRLKRSVYRLLGEIPRPAYLVLEGGGTLAEVWEREAGRRQVAVIRVSPETWRERLLYIRERRSGRQAKQSAGELARKVITWSGASRPTSLRHDAAEAILIGLWGVLEVGWLKELPTEVRILSSPL